MIQGLEKITRVIQSNRFPLTDEKQTQAQIADALTKAGIVFEREARLSESDIVDFLTEDGIAVEAKIKGQRRAIFRQLERYATHGNVRAIVLVTSVAMCLPEAIDGKPARVASLSQGWL